MVLTISFIMLYCIIMVRLTISLPQEFHQRVKKLLPEAGFTTINDYLLDLLRHQLESKPHQNGAIRVVQKDKVLKKKEVSNICEHGYLRKLCVHESCRRKGVS